MTRVTFKGRKNLHANLSECGKIVSILYGGKVERFAIQEGNFILLGGKPVYLNPVYTIDKIITNVLTRYGAPLGRNDVGTRPTNKKIFDCRVVLDNGGYDKGGVYWGFGSELRVSYTKDLSFIKFYRV